MVYLFKLSFMAIKEAKRTIVGAKLVTGEMITGAYPIFFTSEEQLDSFIIAIKAANEGDPTPIYLPNGERLVTLTNMEKWWIDQVIRINLFLLLFSVIR